MQNGSEYSGLPDPVHDAQFYQSVPVKRLIAWLIDMAIIALLTLAGLMLTLGFAAFILPLLFVSAHLVYRIFTLNRWSATAGMRLTGIEIRNKKGDYLSSEESIWHTGLFTIILFFVFPIAISALMMIMGARGQGLHDVLLGTTVINRPE